MSRRKPEKPLSPGDVVMIYDKDHPLLGRVGRLVRWGPYGPAIFSWVGWEVAFVDGTGCFVPSGGVSRV